METANETKNQGTIYELAFLLRTGENDSALEEYLKKAGATVLNKGPQTQIQLTYSIKKQPSATFGFYHLSFAEGVNPTKLSHDLDLKEYLLRHLFVKVPKATGRAAAKERAAAERKNRPIETAATAATPSSRLDTLSNEKLEQALGEILK